MPPWESQSNKVCVRMASGSSLAKTKSFLEKLLCSFFFTKILYFGFFFLDRSEILLDDFAIFDWLGFFKSFNSFLWLLIKAEKISITSSLSISRRAKPFLRYPYWKILGQFIHRAGVEIRYLPEISIKFDRFLSIFKRFIILIKLEKCSRSIGVKDWVRFDLNGLGIKISGFFIIGIFKSIITEILWRLLWDGMNWIGYFEFFGLAGLCGDGISSLLFTTFTHIFEISTINK